MMVFAVSGFHGRWPVPTAAVVIAPGRESCKRQLTRKLAEIGLSDQRADAWTIEPICEAAPGTRAAVYVQSDGNY